MGQSLPKAQVRIELKAGRVDNDCHNNMPSHDAYSSDWITCALSNLRASCTLRKLVVIDQNTVITLSTSETDWAFLFPLDGPVTCVLPGSEVVARESDIILSPRPEGLAFSAQQPVNAVVGIISVDSASHSLIAACLPPILHNHSINGQHPAWFKILLDYINSVDQFSGLGVLSDKITEIFLIEVLRQFLARNMDETRMKCTIRGSAIHQLVREICARPELPWTVADMARKSNLSRSSFVLQFTELMRQPPARFIRQTRMNLAKDLLLKTDLPLSQIAVRVGYGMEAAFSRAFAGIFGFPPIVMRRQMRLMDSDKIRGARSAPPAIPAGGLH